MHAEEFNLVELSRPVCEGHAQPTDIDALVIYARTLILTIHNASAQRNICPPPPPPPPPRVSQRGAYARWWSQKVWIQLNPNGILCGWKEPSPIKSTKDAHRNTCIWMKCNCQQISLVRNGSHCWPNIEHWPYAPGVCNITGMSWRILHSWLVEYPLRDDSRDLHSGIPARTGILPSAMNY